MRHKQKGFTIVELLIVIVVIGILAAITIVAYNGIQSRANNQKTISAVSAYTKAFLQYAAENGVYPPSRSPLPCLGTGYTCDGTTDGSVSTAALLADLRPYMTSTPQPSTTARAGGIPGRAGALYAGSTDADRYILFIQESTTACPTIGGLTQRQAPELSNGHAVCRYSLPPL